MPSDTVLFANYLQAVYLSSMENNNNNGHGPQGGAALKGVEVEEVRKNLAHDLNMLNLIMCFIVQAWTDEDFLDLAIYISGLEAKDGKKYDVDPLTVKRALKTCSVVPNVLLRTDGCLQVMADYVAGSHNNMIEQMKLAIETNQQ